MGRRKTYDRDAIADRAMRLFWERGFHATSTRDLADAMGVNPYSLYAEFGSKEGLYDAAIARYERTVVPHHFGVLEEEGASLDAVRSVLDFFGDNGTREGSHVGCLLANAGIEQAPTSDKSVASTARFVARMEAAFGHALGNAAAEGKLVPDAPVHDLARFFPTVLLGLLLMSRARVGPAVLRAAADQALERLDAITVR